MELKRKLFFFMATSTKTRYLNLVRFPYLNNKTLNITEKEWRITCRTSAAHLVLASVVKQHFHYKDFLYLLLLVYFHHMFQIVMQMLKSDNISLKAVFMWWFHLDGGNDYLWWQQLRSRVYTNGWWVLRRFCWVVLK